jgi:hypothetical protein
MAIGLLIPGFAAAMGWLFLLHPRIGLLNQLLVRTFQLPGPPLNISSILGMGWVQGLNLAPLAFIMTAAVFRSMDPTLEVNGKVQKLKGSLPDLLTSDAIDFIKTNRAGPDPRTTPRCRPG